MKARLLLLVTVIITAITTHFVDRARLLDVRSVSSQEMMEAAAWLDAQYAAADGLQREGGLCQGGRLDAGAIGAWLFESYLQTRIRGTPDDARAAIAAAIRNSEEWQRKHRAQ